MMNDVNDGRQAADGGKQSFVDRIVNAFSALFGGASPQAPSGGNQLHTQTETRNVAGYSPNGGGGAAPFTGRATAQGQGFQTDPNLADSVNEAIGALRTVFGGSQPGQDPLVGPGATVNVAASGPGAVADVTVDNGRMTTNSATLPTGDGPSPSAQQQADGGMNVGAIGKDAKANVAASGPEAVGNMTINETSPSGKGPAGPRGSDIPRGASVNEGVMNIGGKVTIGGAGGGGGGRTAVVGSIGEDSVGSVSLGGSVEPGTKVVGSIGKGSAGSVSMQSGAASSDPKPPPPTPGQTQGKTGGRVGP